MKLKPKQVFETRTVEWNGKAMANWIITSKFKGKSCEKFQLLHSPASSDPITLQQVVWFNLMFLLFGRGPDNLFAVQTDATEI